MKQPKQETLEEAGERLYPNRESFLHRFQNIERKAFTEGAKWQMEISYSEEEVKRLAFDFYYDMSYKMSVPTNLISENATNVDVWFKKLKRNNMTAVEWLIEELKKSLRKEIEQAKEMEKRQQDDFAIGFAEWVDINYFVYNTWKESKSITELLEIYKKTLIWKQD